MQVWEEELQSKSKKTRWIYRHELKRFLERYGWTPKELYEIRKADLESEDTRDHQNIERKVKALMTEMMEGGLSASTARCVAKAISSFLEAQGLDLNLKAKDKPRAVYNGQNLALIEDIRIMWRDASVRQRERNKALIVVTKDSGLRVSDVSLLNMKDWREARTIETEIGKVKVFKPKATLKTGDIAHIHLGPESIEAVDEYLKVRYEWVSSETDRIEPLFLDEQKNRIKDKAISNVMARLENKTDRSKISAHSLRKFHRTRLEGAGMPEAWVKRLQGKAASVYSLPQQSGDLTKRYVECYHALRIFEEPERKIKELENEVNRLRNREQELDDLRRIVKHQGELILKLMERANS